MPRNVGGFVEDGEEQWQIDYVVVVPLHESIHLTHQRGIQGLDSLECHLALNHSLIIIIVSEVFKSITSFFLFQTEESSVQIKNFPEEGLLVVQILRCVLKFCIINSFLYPFSVVSFRSFETVDRNLGIHVSAIFDK